MLNTFINNYKLNESFHVLRNNFNDVIEVCYTIIEKNILICYKNINYLNGIIGKVIDTEYVYNTTNNTVSAHDGGEFPKVLLRFVKTQEYLFAFNKGTDILIDCNIVAILQLYNYYSSFKFKSDNVDRFKQHIMSGLKHEFMHMFQSKTDPFFNVKTFRKLKVLDEYLQDCEEYPYLSEYDKESIYIIFRYCQDTEISAVINAIDEFFSHYNKETLFNELKHRNENITHAINDDVIKECLLICSDITKLDHIITILNYLESQKLISVVDNINKYLKIYSPNNIRKFLKEYEVKLMRQIYFILHNNLKYDIGEKDTYGSISECFAEDDELFLQRFYLINDVQ